MSFWRRRIPAYNATDTRNDNKAIESLSVIAAKHKIKPKLLVETLVKAWEREKSRCKKMSIECRKKSNNGAVFLFTKNRKVAEQFTISRRILQKPEELIQLIEYTS